METAHRIRLERQEQSDPRGQLGHPRGVTVGVGVLGFDGADQCVERVGLAVGDLLQRDRGR